MTMIIRVDPRKTAQTCLKLVDLCGQQFIPLKEHCGRPVLDAYVQVYRSGCHEIRPAKRVWCGCQYLEMEPAESAPPGVKYGAFELDEGGRVCFYWDSLLLEQKPGRYDVDLYVRDEKLSNFQIDLRSKIRIAEVVNRQARACANC